MEGRCEGGGKRAAEKEAEDAVLEEGAIGELVCGGGRLGDGAILANSRNRELGYKYEQERRLEGEKMQ